MKSTFWILIAAALLSVNLAVPGEWYLNFNVPVSWAVANFAKNLLAPGTFVSSILSSRGTNWGGFRYRRFRVHFTVIPFLGAPRRFCLAYVDWPNFAPMTLRKVIPFPAEWHGRSQCF